MLKVGIDRLAIYTPRYSLNLKILAKARGIDPDKFQIGLGQHAMSVPPPGEDIITMAANAARKALQDIDLNQIDMLLFATESGLDQSKAAGIFVHDLLNLPARCRVGELKQACYAGTFALQLAIPYLREHPQKKVLVIASDIARYGLGAVAESSQGAGAIAMVLSANPRIIAFEPEFGVNTESVMDFWRPPYLPDALVDGKYSSKLYLTNLEKTWRMYSETSERSFNDHDFFCFHIPVPKLVDKAHQHLLKINGRDAQENETTKYIDTLHYSREVGNCYTASLYIGLTSLLDHVKDLADKRIGFYSYGSGCVAEFFSGIVQEDYRNHLYMDYHQQLLKSRKSLNYDEYESFYKYHYPEDDGVHQIPSYNTGYYQLVQIEKHKRIYEPVMNPEMYFDIVTHEDSGEIKGAA